MIETIDKFRFQIEDRKKRKFYGAKTTASLKQLDEQKQNELKCDFDVSIFEKFSKFLPFLGFLRNSQQVH
jgi:hypothetical protein